MDTPPSLPPSAPTVPLPHRAIPKRKPRRRILIITALVVLVGLLIWFHAPTANNHLRARDIPTLPASAKVEHLREGGFFAGFLFIRATLSPEDFDHYSTRFTQPREIIGRGKDQLRIIRPADNDVFLENAPSYEIQTQSILAGTESWWTPHEITNGFAYRWTDGVDGWRVYFDAQRHLVFIYWHHS